MTPSPLKWWHIVDVPLKAGVETYKWNMPPKINPRSHNTKAKEYNDTMVKLAGNKAGELLPDVKIATVASAGMAQVVFQSWSSRQEGAGY